MLSADGTFPVIVVAQQQETSEVVSLELALPDGSELPTWTPGAHIDVAVGAAGVRQYSLCGDPQDRHRWRIGVLLERDGRGGSRYLHRESAPGNTLTVSLPRNNFALEPSRDYIFVAGGIGITPILPMIAAAHAEGATWTLHYGGRTRQSMAYLDEISEYGSRVRVLPQDECGLLPLDDILAGIGPDAQVYCCGPEPLLAAIEPVDSQRLHVERFRPRSVDEALGPDRDFTVKIASTGATIRVGEDQSIVDALEDAGIVVETSCREGTCASCETPVLEGEVCHRDSVLTAHEREQSASIMLCVSRARTDLLVLDL
ncbi:PDR/VanB family oxidoreductase [Rhodococcus wratislaviensis]|uniref:Putative oxidoreductase n=1 Tax=Rhodococcus wratislaviensis NBRC 100605 TaxID=1219028 RepID=X0PY22_RHOWR|nr:PDR/VanB family oxidoreductase [Rhodococcus wratislaviensis]GAF43292.1 putative oxidoreductase [Rhodococcus wratislaviensis NBRC 100605]